MTEEKTLGLALEALEGADWYINQLEMIVYFVDDDGTHENRLKVQQAITAIKETLAKLQERYFCSRCGKRLSKDINDVHSCTPPRDIHLSYEPTPLRTFDDYGNKIK